MMNYILINHVGFILKPLDSWPLFDISFGCLLNKCCTIQLREEGEEESNEE